MNGKKHLDYGIIEKYSLFMLNERNISNDDLNKVEEHISECVDCFHDVRNCYESYRKINSFSVKTFKMAVIKNRISLALKSLLKIQKEYRLKMHINQLMKNFSAVSNMAIQYSNTIQGRNLAYSRFMLNERESLSIITPDKSICYGTEILQIRGLRGDKKHEVINTKKVIINLYDRCEISIKASEDDSRIEVELNGNTSILNKYITLLCLTDPEASQISELKLDEKDEKQRAFFEKIKRGEYLVLFEEEEVDI